MLAREVLVSTDHFPSPPAPHPALLQRAVFEEMKLEGKQSYKLLAVLNRGLLISKEM